MDALFQDIRYALRTLRKGRAFAAVAMVTLALGIGASAAIFSVVDNVLMEPFPYKDANRLVSVHIHDQDKSDPGGRGGYSSAEFLAFAEQNHVFDGVIGAGEEEILYKNGEGTERFYGAHITPGTFELFGMPALLGRVAQPADYEPGAPPVFVLRYKTWVNRFNGDPAILNKTFVLSGVPRTLIGIMQPRFGWYDADVFIPDKPTLNASSNSGALQPYWFLLGHLKPGVSMSEAGADLTVVAKHLAEIYPADYPKHFSAYVQLLGDGVIGSFRATLYTIFAAVGLLLLIGCANVANLMLARAMAREKEFALRAAMGAGRFRLVQQLLVESLVLAVSAAGLGTLLAWGGLKFIVAAMPESTIPTESVIQLNGAALAFTLAMAILTAVLFGLAPALQVAQRDLNDPLHDSSKGVGGGFRRGRLRDAVVVLEVALSLVLLVGAGLLMRSFVALREINLGFQPDHVLVVRLPLPLERYKTGVQVTNFFRPLLARLKALPGVAGAAEASAVPPYEEIQTGVEIPGSVHQEKWTAFLQLSSEDYFSVLRMRRLAGRTFSAAEVDAARKLAVVNETFVRRYVGQERSPIGEQVRVAELENFPDPVRGPWFEIIGVVADAKNQGIQEPAEPELWIPYTVTGSGSRGILVRTAQNPLALMDSVRREIWATDSGVALAYVDSLEGYLSSYSYAGPRFAFFVMTIFAGVGLVLVALGIYSMLAYTTARRTHEIGIRMALGAEGSDVLRLVIKRGLALVIAGAAIGLATTLALGRVIAAQLWQVSASDPATLAVVILLLLVTGLAACWVPARRAARVDPLIALRYE